MNDLPAAAPRDLDAEMGLAVAEVASARPPATTLPPNPFDKIQTLVQHPPRVPKIGADASHNMALAFEKVASDIEAAAAEGMARAAAVQQEAASYASVIRQAGERLCREIEDETVRCCSLSQVMEEALRAFSPKTR